MKEFHSSSHHDQGWGRWSAWFVGAVLWFGLAQCPLNGEPTSINLTSNVLETSVDRFIIDLEGKALDGAIKLPIDSLSGGQSSGFVGTDMVLLILAVLVGAVGTVFTLFYGLRRITQQIQDAIAVLSRPCAVQLVTGTEMTHNDRCCKTDLVPSHEERGHCLSAGDEDHSRDELCVAPSEARIPRVVLSRGLLPVISNYIGRFLQERGGDVEAGGVLVGEFDNHGAEPTITVTGIIEAGRDACCLRSSLSIIPNGITARSPIVT